MTPPQHRVWTGERWIDVSVPESGGEAVVVPNVAAIVLEEPDRMAVLLQRRDKPGEVVRGRWEVPGGRWRAGESAEGAIRREVIEETGLEIQAIISPIETLTPEPNVGIGIVRPVAVVAGIDGALPSLHVIVVCTAAGRPRPAPGETADPTWWALDDLRSRLAAHPEEFVWQSHAILSTWLADGPGHSS